VGSVVGRGHNPLYMSLIKTVKLTESLAFSLRAPVANLLKSSQHETPKHGGRPQGFGI